MVTQQLRMVSLGAGGWEPHSWALGRKPHYVSGVYFLVEDGTAAVKIGRAVEPGKALGRAQIGNFRRLTLACVIPLSPTEAHVAEEGLHARFRPWWLAGEWFSLSGEVLAFLNQQVRQCPECAIRDSER
jgi:hypothetical protein